MSEFKGTPGPWVVDESRHEGSINRLDPFRHIGMVSQFQYDTSSRAENEANAKLIAAAPDLLYALEIVVHSWTSQFESRGHLAPEWCKQARAAIAKATE